MTPSTHRRMALVALVGAAGLAVWAGDPLARGDGVNGRSQSTTGCSCHSSTPNSNGAVTATISGPAFVAPNSTHSYTITVSGGPAGATGGFDLLTSSGTIVPGTGTKLLSGDLVHSDNTRRTWTFDWIAPATDGVASFYLVGLASNGSGSSGDSWNWYGNAVNTAFPVSVNALVAVGDESADRLWLGPAAPNPTVAASTVHFTLPNAGNVRIVVFDARGARVATIASGEYSAGSHAAVWDGRGDDGSRAPAGWYAIRLETGGTFRTTRVLRLGS